MKTLYLVRHGQANSKGRNYDRLSSLGKKQSRLLGEEFKLRHIKIDTLVTGSLKRQQQTADSFIETFGNIKQRVEIENLNEFHMSVWIFLAREIRKEDRDFARIVEEWKQARLKGGKAAGRTFKLMIQQIMMAWVENRYPGIDIETFKQFKARVLKVPSLLEKQPGENILAISSGGPTGQLLGRALGLSPRKSLPLMQYIYNTSVNHFELADKNLRLITMNSLPHLRDLKQHTLV